MASSKGQQHPICLHSFIHSFTYLSSSPLPLSPSPCIGSTYCVTGLRVQLAYQIPNEQRLGAYTVSSAVCGWTPRFPSHTLRVQRDADSSYIDAIVYGLNECLLVSGKQGQTDEKMCVSV